MSIEPVTSTNQLSVKGALAQLKPRQQSDTSQSTEAPKTASEAARTLGLRSAELRKQQQAPAGQTGDKAANQRTAQARPEAQDNEEEHETEDNSASAEPEGQDGTEEQSSEAAEGSEGGDGQDPTIVIDGETLTAQEIRDSYLRREDYSRKTAEIADQRRTLESTLGNVTQNAQRIDNLLALLEQAVGQEPDWPTLAAQMDPREYNSAKERWLLQRNTLNQARADKDRASSAAIQQAKAAMFDEAARTFRPEWQDREKLQKGIQSLADYAVAEGINPQELQMLHRTPMLRILDKAFRYDEMQKTARVTDKRVVNKPKPLQPGTHRPRASAAEASFQSEKARWEGLKNPSTIDAKRWVQAKRSFQAATGKKVGG